MDEQLRLGRVRTRWAAIGAAVAITLGACGIGVVNAVDSSGPRTTYTAITPCRLADTRPSSQIGVRAGKLGAQEAQTHNVVLNAENGDCPGFLGDITAIVTNTTVIQPSARTFVSLNPGTSPTTTSSSINVPAGSTPVPNAVTIGVDNAGRFTIYNNSGTVHYAIDLVGFYRPHDHDDRYYTKQQVAAQVAAATPLLESTDLGGGTNLGNVPEVVRSVAITTSGPGQVMVTASGWFEAAMSVSAMRCDLTLSALAPTGPVSNDGFEVVQHAVGDAVPYSTTRVFTVTGRSTTTARLRCDETVGSVTLRDNAIHAMFVRD